MSREDPKIVIENDENDDELEMEENNNDGNFETQSGSGMSYVCPCVSPSVLSKDQVILPIERHDQNLGVRTGRVNFMEYHIP